MVCCKLVDLVNVIKAKAESQKKVTKVNDLEDSIRTILNVLDYVNSLDEFAYTIWDNRPLDEIPVLNEFKDFILPSAVRYDALNRRTNDVLIKVEDVKLECQSYNDYIMACDKFRSTFKKDGYSDITTIGSLRKPVNFNDVVMRASFGGMVNAQGRPFWPIPLKKCDYLFDSRFFNDELKKIVYDYISEMRFV